MKKIINNIPNILTIYRIIVALLIPFLFSENNYWLLFILFFIALISDLIDGYLARKLNAVSQLGKILDIVGDKLLALLATIVFTIQINSLLIFLIVGEIFIVIPFLYILLINKNSNKEIIQRFSSSKYGKFKTWILFVTLGIAFISYKINLSYILYIFISISFILQIYVSIDYIKNYKKLLTNKI